MSDRREYPHPTRGLAIPQRTLAAARADGVDTSSLPAVKRWLEQRKRGGA